MEVTDQPREIAALQMRDPMGEISLGVKEERTVDGTYLKTHSPQQLPA